MHLNASSLKDSCSDSLLVFYYYCLRPGKEGIHVRNAEDSISALVYSDKHRQTQTDNNIMFWDNKMQVASRRTST